MTSGVEVERVETLDPAAHAQCDFAYPFDSAFAVSRAAQMIAILRVDGRVAGYVACLRDGDAGAVRRLEIDRARRGQGLGRRLLAEARSWGAELGLSALVLETLADHPASGRFFAHNGFVLHRAAQTLHWRLPLGDQKPLDKHAPEREGAACSTSPLSSSPPPRACSAGR